MGIWEKYFNSASIRPSILVAKFAARMLGEPFPRKSTVTYGRKEGVWEGVFLELVYRRTSKSVIHCVLSRHHY